MSYQEFISGKHRRANDVGIDIGERGINAAAFPFQAAVIRWALRKGRAAIFADCGLGKSLMMLEWMRLLIETGNVTRGLILCPIAVGPQMLREVAKFKIGVDAQLVADSSEVKSGINITNYEKLHKFDVSAFQAVSLDESSILKSYAGATKRMLCDSFRQTRFKLACTATPAPNDHMELGNQCDYLGIMPSNEMLARWFFNDSMKCGGYRLKGHAAADFWNWMASWAMSLRMPSDLGFQDEGFDLPPLNMIEHITASGVPAGHLFATGQEVSATTVHVEKRASLDAKADRVAELVADGETWACWVDTNYEADALKKRIRDAVDVRGSDSESSKASRLDEFTKGNIRVIITKPEIGGWGLNWQNCHKTTYFAGFSFERWYQSVRRLWRFGQVNPVDCHLIASENEAGVVSIMKRKQADADELSLQMCTAMRDGMLDELSGLRHLHEYRADQSLIIPDWLSQRMEEPVLC